VTSVLTVDKSFDVKVVSVNVQAEDIKVDNAGKADQVMLVTNENLVQPGVSSQSLSYHLESTGFAPSSLPLASSSVSLVFLFCDLLSSSICCRPSVCLSSCLSVTLVHPTQAVQLFGKISMALSTRGVAKYSDFGPMEGSISETVQDRKKVSINH